MIVLEADFSLPVSGRIHNPPRGQQFGSQGECWTLQGVAYLERFRPGQHVHIGGDFPIPGNSATVTVEMRLAELPPLEGAYMPLVQCTPSDGAMAAKVVELRIYPDRTLAVGCFQEKAPLLTLEPAPVDVTFEVSFPLPYFPAGRLRNPRQTLGGTSGTTEGFVQEVSAWRIEAA